MSNEVFNQHIEFGEPLGEFPDLYEAADWAGEMIKTARILLKNADLGGTMDEKEWLEMRNRWLYEGKP